MILIDERILVLKRHMIQITAPQKPARVQFPKTIANKAMECAELICAGKEGEVAKHYYVSGDNITEENLDQYDGNTY